MRAPSTVAGRLLYRSEEAVDWMTGARGEQLRLQALFLRRFPPLYLHPATLFWKPEVR